MSVRHEFACRSLILYLKEPPPTHRTIPDSIHIALTNYSPRITTGSLDYARWVVERWTGGDKIIFRGEQAWVQVVSSAGGRADVILDGLRALLTVSLRDFCSRAASMGAGGLARV